MRDLNSIDTTGAIRIAHATSKGDGRARWSELSVFYFPHPPADLRGKRWLAETRGCSTVPGEREKVRRMTGGTLDRALKLIDESDLGLIVIEAAKDWAEEAGIPVDRPVEPPVPDNDIEALRWLYGPTVSESSFARMLQRDFGIGESTTRAALKNGTPVKVPLRSVLRFFNREAFRTGNDVQGREMSSA